VLLPHDFKFDPRLHGDLMATLAILRLRELIEVDAFEMNRLSGAFVVGGCFDFEVVLFGNYLRNPFAANRAVDRRVDFARLDAALAVRFSVSILDAMAR